MPSLARLVVSNLRNIERAELRLAPGFNLFFGNNGSGKTSILEAIHLLAMGRSFRGHAQKPLVQDGCLEATVFGETADGLALGILRPVRGAHTIQVAGKRAESLAELSYNLPVQLINTDAFLVLEGGPQDRRRFLDWGVFHVEQPFLQSWRRARRALQQRNSLLKANANAAELEPWTEELSKSAELVDRDRTAYVQKFREELAECLATLPDISGSTISIEYQRGWDQDRNLAEQLKQDLLRERKYGHTLAGPHRAELRIRTGQHDIADVFSRGQLKLLVCAMKVAQARLLYKETGRRCLFLIDDLPAELDSQNKAIVCQMMAALGTQVLMTSIERGQLESDIQVCTGTDYKLFHVKHGNIAGIENQPDDHSTY